MDYGAIKRNIWYGLIPWGLSRAFPVFVMLIFGEDIVNTLVENMPEWLTGGLSVAGGLLPAVGIAILLRYLPVKKYISYLLIGFFCGSISCSTDVWYRNSWSSNGGDFIPAEFERQPESSCGKCRSFTGGIVRWRI